MTDSLPKILVVWTAAILSLGLFATAQENAHVQSYARESLKNVVSVDGTDDGKFLYAVGYDPGLLVCLQRDPDTGKVEQIQAIEKDLKGAIGVTVSPDQKWVGVCSYDSKKIVMFRRDQDSGQLEEASKISADDDGVTGMAMPISMSISPDSKFVYVSNGAGTLTVLSMSDTGKLSFLQRHMGLEGKLNGCRMMATNPEGTHFFIPCIHSNSVAVFDRDVDAGHVRILSVIENGEDGASQLTGAIGADCSPDGKHVYVTSGRFQGGANSVSVFEVLESGKLRLIQELVHPTDVVRLNGPNSVNVSPDGKQVYVTTAHSGGVVCFARDVESGQLEFQSDLKIEDTADLGMCAGIWSSADNRHIYICGERRQSIYVFQRSGQEE